MVRTDSHQLRPVAGDSDLVEAIKVVARSHKTLITERTRHVLRLRQALREYFPAALHAFDDLSSADALELLAKAPTPSTAARLSITQIRNALRRARRRNVIEKAETLKAVLRSTHLAQSDRVAEAYAAVVRSLVAVLETLNDEIASLAGEVETLFGRHPDAAVYLSQPGLGLILTNNSSRSYASPGRASAQATRVLAHHLRIDSCETAMQRASINSSSSRKLKVKVTMPFVESEMTAAYAPDYIESLTPRMILGRKGDPGELAATLVWLASPAGGYVTGQTIAVDGGVTIT